jgi:hypothetical protein
MEPINQHISKYLNSLIAEYPIHFETSLNEIQNELTYEIKKTIKYVDDIINKVFNQNNNELLSLHININYHLSDDYKLIIAQYLLIKFHYEHLLINKLNSFKGLDVLYDGIKHNYVIEKYLVCIQNHIIQFVSNHMTRL